MRNREHESKTEKITVFQIMRSYFRMPVIYASFLLSESLEQVRQWSAYDEGFPLGGVYMRKLAPVRVSYRHDFLISYRVYMMTGLFHISLFEGTLHVDKMHI